MMCSGVSSCSLHTSQIALESTSLRCRLVQNWILRWVSNHMNICVVYCAYPYHFCECVYPSWCNQFARLSLSTKINNYFNSFFFHNKSTSASIFQKSLEIPKTGKKPYVDHKISPIRPTLSATSRTSLDGPWAMATAFELSWAMIGLHTSPQERGLRVDSGLV